MRKMGPLIINNNRIFFKNKILIIFSILFPILFSTFFSLIFTNYENVNRIPIAVIDNDLSEISINIISKLNQNESIRVVTTNLKEANKFIRNNRIEAIFVFKKNFGNKLKSSDYTESVELIYLDKSSIGPSLGDIVASDIMTDLAIYKAANTAVTYNDRYNLEAEDIYNKTVSIGREFLNESIFEMHVNSIIQTPSSEIVDNIDIDRILKINVTLGFSLVVLSFVILFSNGHIIESYNINTTKQLLCYGYKSHQLYLSNVLSIFITGSLVVLGQLIFFIIGLGIYNPKSILLILFTLVLHVLFLANFVVLFTSILKSKLKYQSIIAPLVFLFGLLGGAFWSVEFLSKNISWISYFSPIYWSLKIMNGTILNVAIPGLSGIILGYIAFLLLLTSFSILIYKIYIKQLRIAN